MMPKKEHGNSKRAGSLVKFRPNRHTGRLADTYINHDLVALFEPPTELSDESVERYIALVRVICMNQPGPALEGAAASMTSAFCDWLLVYQREMKTILSDEASDCQKSYAQRQCTAAEIRMEKIIDRANKEAFERRKQEVVFRDDETEEVLGRLGFNAIGEG